ncbi:hypothetical protein LRP67_03515 [Nocardioides sp. cx-169]|uniref:hypothetical protein n=1 Tax=Nocardioides sp. cx-169 TaxID=2899080 RepID=UPI001E30B8B9|nr:hypothetical protein [Nocardioides sp. cx-169]MCD4533147.1 hypothetical protein [Nocardioides sp. cx-169]
MRPTFFGMHDGRVTQGSTPDAPVGALRFWDSGTSWRELETRPGQFTWSGLDTAVVAAESVGARPLLVLGQTPPFHALRPGVESAYGAGAASMPELGAWRRYVSAVAKRYGDRIDYQVWNEANVVNYWAGTPRQMAELTVVASQSIRQVAPRATVVAPPFVLRLSGQQDYFTEFWSWQSRGIDLESAVDAVAVNLYPLAEGLPEAQVELLEQARDVLAMAGVELPVWNTEINFGLGGGLTPPPISPERQRAFVLRNFLVNASLGVQRVYWYRWDLQPIANTLLTTPDFATPTLAGRAFSLVHDWLNGTRVGPCASTAGVWKCTARAGRQTRTFWWKPNGRPTQMTVRGPGASWTDAAGSVTRCPEGCRVTVDESPVMVTSG